MAKSKFLENFEYYPVKFLFYIFQLIPYKKGIKFGAKLFKLIFSILPPLKKVTYKNLEIIEKGIDEKILFHSDENHNDEFNYDINTIKRKFNKKHYFKIYKKMVQNLGRVFFNLIYYPKIKNNEFVNLVNIIGMDNLKETLKMGKGAVIASPHIGNWEVFGCACAILGIPVNVIVRPLDNKKLDAYIESFRTQKKAKIISKFDNPKKFFKPLFNNEILAVMFDQNALKFGVYIPFFKRPASATQGTSRFHLVSKAPIVPGYSYYDENGKLFGVFEKPLDFDYMFNTLEFKHKLFLFSFYEYFNKNNKNIPIYIFNKYLNFDENTTLFIKSKEVTEEKYKKLYKETEGYILQNYLDRFKDYNKLTKDEKSFFITYFVHKYYEPIILKHIESWMLIHPRWKKQPKEYIFPYK